MKALHESWIDILEAAQDRIALQTPEGGLPYSSLEDRSCRLSTRLQSHRGGNALIAVPFSSDYYVALHACMRSKVTACPVDLTIPHQLLVAQVSRLSISCIIACQDTHLSESYPDIPIINLGEEVDVPSPCEGLFSNTEEGKLFEDSPLLRLFTSGSSGEQSLVTIGNLSMAHDVLHTPKMLEIVSGDVFCSLGSYVSAMQIYAFWRCVLNGITFVPIDPKVEGISAACNRLLNLQPGILRGHMTIISEILESCRSMGVLQNTSRLILGGEPLKSSRLKSIMDLLPSLDSITHNFSTTETLFISAFTEKPDFFFGMERIPVGHPQPGKDVFICDEKGMSLPFGEVGEIVVRSEYICSDIQGRDLHVRFACDPYTGVWTYRTGDLGRMREDGMLEHLGRVDRQIKINGVRIDPYIVEQCIESHDGVVSCLVSEVEHNGTKILVAVYTSLTEIETDRLRKHIIPLLSVSHHPTIFMRFDSIPTTQRGKPALTEIGRMIQQRLASEVTVEGLKLSTPTEHRLAAIWSELLGLDVQNRDADFFRLGGNSLKAMRLAGMIGKEFEVFMPLTKLYTNGRLEDLASFIDGKSSPESDFRTVESDTYKTYCAWQGTGPRQVYSFFLGARSIVKVAELCQWKCSVIELMDPQIQKGEIPDLPVEKLVPVYADAILAAHRKGPIVLMGNCVNGIDAYATACHLQYRTDETIHVLLFDTRSSYATEDSIHILKKGKSIRSIFAETLFKGWTNTIRRLAEHVLRGSGTANTAIRILFRETLANRLFDPDWYLSKYPDIAQAGVDPLSHYLAMGWREMRDPSVVFNRSIYGSICLDFRSGRHDPILHYMLIGRFNNSVRKAVRELHVSTKDSERIIAFGWFDAEWYTCEYPSVDNHDRLPLDHYMAIGWKFDRKPFPDYDPEEFTKLFPGFKPGKTNPLRHLLSMRKIPRRTEHIIEMTAHKVGTSKSYKQEKIESKEDAMPERTPNDPQYIPADDSELIKTRTIVRSHYRPESFRGEVHIFTNQFSFDRDPTNGWKNGQHGRIHSIRMNGNHYTYLADDIKTNAWKVDAVIRKILNQVIQ